MDTTEKNPSHLMNKAVLPAVVRFGLPLFIAGVICILIPSDIGSGVGFDATIDGTNLEIKLIVVSVFSSVKELWNAGSYLLPILIIIFSIAWPYSNLLLSLICWVTPWKRSNVRRREMVVALLDVLGKWGVFDTFVLMILMVSLRINTSPAALGLQGIVELQSNSGIDVDENSLRTWLTPLWGFYGFFAAALLSLVGTHILMFFQRKAIFCNERIGDMEDNSKTKMPLAEMSGISIPNPNFLIVPSVVFASLLVTGFCIKVIEFKYITSVGEDTVVYSLLDFGVKLRGTPLPGVGKSGPTFMAVIYYIMCLVMPVINLIAFIVLFLRPMTKVDQRKMFYIAETTFAWAAAGPLLASLFSSADQVPRFANSIVSANCPACLQVQSDMKWSILLFLLGTVGHGFMAFYLMHKAHIVLYPISQQ